MIRKGLEIEFVNCSKLMRKENEMSESHISETHRIVRRMAIHDRPHFGKKQSLEECLCELKAMALHYSGVFYSGRMATNLTQDGCLPSHAWIETVDPVCRTSRTKQIMASGATIRTLRLLVGIAIEKG